MSHLHPDGDQNREGHRLSSASPRAQGAQDGASSPARTGARPLNGTEAAAPWASLPAEPEADSAVGAPETPGRADERPGTASSAVTAVLTGLVVGPVATAMHGGIWYLDGWWLPWGLVFSGALLLCAGVWCGTSTRRVWAAAVPGLITYLVAWAGAYLRQGSALVATTWTAPIGVVGILWFVVVFLAVMAAVIVTGRWLVRHRAR